MTITEHYQQDQDQEFTINIDNIEQARQSTQFWYVHRDPCPPH